MNPPQWLNCLRTHSPMQETQKRGFDPRVGKIPWRSKRQPAPVFLPGKSNEQRSLVGGVTKSQTCNTVK